jgi:S-adenosylmethionine:tRNA ribosyltransferase-isomerase
MNVDLSEYDYDLPEDRIAQYPLSERDRSKLLIDKGGKLSSTLFYDLGKYIQPGTLLVFNNSKVIRARFLFQKESGARIEVFCIEPVSPAEYAGSFSSNGPVEWKCIIGNLKRWKSGLLCQNFEFNKKEVQLCSEKVSNEDDTWVIRFTWNDPSLIFSDILSAAGHVPLPPYIHREDEPEDGLRYQTVYSKINGSVAAPTAGLHFTPGILDKLSAGGILKTEITLHVGAGTFQPVREEQISDHPMHNEYFVVKRSAVESVINNLGKIVAVGTTSVRTLESLYWIGAKILRNRVLSDQDLSIDQWEPYRGGANVSAEESLGAIVAIMDRYGWKALPASTKLMIIPGYRFMTVNGMITNFHQPRSTLLLLISAWLGDRWKEVYRYALENNFRFLSYGDSSLLLR